MNIDENCKAANCRSYKQSDKRVLSAEAKVIVALIKKQPQKRDDLCRSATIDTSTFYRIRRLLMNKGIIEETEKGYALWFYSETRSLWDRLKYKLEEMGGNLVDLKVDKFELSDTRDPITGWRKKRYTKSSIKGIMILRGALELVAAAGIYIAREYDAVLLTADPIEDMDRLWWKSKLYEVKNVEERYDGYNFSFNIAYLTELVRDREDKETAEVYARSKIYDARSQTRTLLTTFLSDANIVRDDDAKAVYAVICSDPSYDIMKEFQASTDPVDGLYVIGESETIPLRNGDQEVRDYEERVPIFIFTINRAGVRGMKLKRTMEAELRHICETHPDGIYRTLLRVRDNDQRRRSAMLYSTEFVLNYTRPAPQRKG